MRRILFLIAGGTLLALAGAELGARGVLQPRGILELAAEREKFKENGADPASGLQENGHWEDSLQLHPFFGYVGRASKVAVNRFGFYSHHEIGLCGSSLCLAESPAEKSEKPPLVVGIFGGSLALQVGSDEAFLEKLLMPMFPGRSVRVINFALPGHAMPQEFFVYSYFRELVHVAVFLDGLNEVWNAVDNNRLGFPPVYAKGVHYKFLSAGADSSVDTLKDLLRARRQKDRLRSVTGWSLKRGFRSFALTHLLWKAFLSRTLENLQKLQPEVTENSARYFPQANSEIIGVGVRSWADYHAMAASLAKSRGTFALHLLQPTLFDGGKPLTDEERARTLAFPKLEQLVKESYPQLRKELSKLDHSKDLSGMFSGEKGGIWLDAAHVNAEGRERLARKIVELLGLSRFSIH